MAIHFQPEGYHSMTPCLVVNGAQKLIDFLTGAFGAQERFRMPMPDGSIAHAELTIGDSIVMVGDATEQYPAGSSFVHLYVPDADAVYQKALEHGATTITPPEDQFYGERSATITDPLGNRWTISTHVEDISEEEMKKRMAAMG